MSFEAYLKSLLELNFLDKYNPLDAEQVREQMGLEWESLDDVEKTLATYVAEALKGNLRARKTIVTLPDIGDVALPHMDPNQQVQEVCDINGCGGEIRMCPSGTYCVKCSAGGGPTRPKSY